MPAACRKIGWNRVGVCDKIGVRKKTDWKAGEKEEYDEAETSKKMQEYAGDAWGGCHADGIFSPSVFCNRRLHQLFKFHSSFVV